MGQHQAGSNNNTVPPLLAAASAASGNPNWASKEPSWPEARAAPKELMACRKCGECAVERSSSSVELKDSPCGKKALSRSWTYKNNYVHDHCRTRVNYLHSRYLWVGEDWNHGFWRDGISQIDSYNRKTGKAFFKINANKWLL